MRNLKAWLSGNPDLPDSKIGELGDLVRNSRPFGNYSIIKWSHGYDASEACQEQLLDFVQKGGALMCASTPWGYLQVYPEKTLQDMSLHNFLKNFMGIVFTANSLWLGDEITVAENRAKHSQFDLALEKVTSNPQKIGKYLGTISCGLGQLNNEGILPTKKILELKDMVILECQNSGWNPVPCNRRPVRTQEEKNATKLLSQCMNLTEGL